MAEQFLEKIYADSIIIDQLRECLRLIARYDDRQTMKKYNQAMAGLERLMDEYAQGDPKAATSIQNDALRILEHWDDIAYVTGVIEGGIIPKLYRYMSFFTDIEVEDEGYLLKSSDSGFLTLRSPDTGFFMHDVHDPMQEAGRIADIIYKPEMEHIIIFGCGLGYLPYKIWERSQGAVKITIYEEDEKILSYAKSYGVLSWIDEKNLEIICDPDPVKVIKLFVDNIDYVSKEKCIYISYEKKVKFKGIADGQFDYVAALVQYNWELGDAVKINIWKNKKSKQISYDELRQRVDKKEWVMVAAGPSLDDNIEFLKESKGSRTIIAVNTVLKRLKKENIVPDLICAADSYEQLVEHIIGAEDFTEGVPLLADWATNWKYTERYRGDKCFVCTPTSREVAEDEGRSEDIWDVSGTVSCMAMEAAVRLGGKVVYLVGLDLAFPGGKDYAGNMPHGKVNKKGGTIQVKSVDGGMVETARTFNTFIGIIADNIAKHPDITFYNMSKHGAYIEGAKKLI